MKSWNSTRPRCIKEPDVIQFMLQGRKRFTGQGNFKMMPQSGVNLSGKPKLDTPLFSRGEQ